jgi:hypothetical protein
MNKRSIRNQNSAIRNVLSLFLLVFRVGADDAHNSLAADNLTILTNTANAASDFHDHFPANTKTGPKTSESSNIAKFSIRLK